MKAFTVYLQSQLKSVPYHWLGRGDLINPEKAQKIIPKPAKVHISKISNIPTINQWSH